MDSRLEKVSWPGWNVVRRIGSGSFGTVYEIERKVFARTEKAALKVITIPQSNSDIDDLYSDGYDSESITQRYQSYLEDIMQEYSLMAEMKGNTNVVDCDDFSYIQHDDGIGWDIYIKMELLTPLVKTLPKNIPDEVAIRLGIDICNALVLCKKRNIIHRDIKPQNIFVSQDGNYKLGDFGIAKAVERTTSGSKTGTYKYMAPEVYNSEPYGSASDIYSLGLVLYWLLNERRTPFLPMPPETPTVRMEDDARNRRLRGEKIPAPKHGSEELKTVVLKACAYEPKDRYADPAEMRGELEAVLYGREFPKKELETVIEEPDPVPAVVDVPVEEETVGPEISTRNEELEDVTEGPEFFSGVKDKSEEDEPEEPASGGTVGPVFLNSKKSVSHSKKEQEEHERIRREQGQRASPPWWIVKEEEERARRLRKEQEKQEKKASKSVPGAKHGGWVLAILTLVVAIIGLFGVLFLKQNEEKALLALVENPQAYQAYKQYLISCVGESSLSIAERISAKNAIQSCDTAEELVACPYYIRLIKEKICVHYNKWTPNDQFEYGITNQPEETLEIYKDYLIVSIDNAELSVAEHINAENAIQKYNTAEELATSAYLMPLFSRDILLPYDEWIASGMPCILTATSPSNIRSGPGTEYEVLTTIESGQTIECVGKEQGWYCVIFDGQGGYIYESLVQMTEPATSTSPKENGLHFWWTNLSWGNHIIRGIYNCEDYIAEISASTTSDSCGEFSNSTIIIEDCYGNELPLSSFDFAWQGNLAYISPSAGLADGVYHIVFLCEHGDDLRFSLCYGYEGEYYMSHDETYWSDFSWQNVANGRYLTKTENTLTTTQNYDERTFFESPSHICGVADDGDGVYPAVLSMSDFTTSSYVQYDGADVETFVFDGWYLASDTTGNVYLSDELNDECYWTFPG